MENQYLSRIEEALASYLPAKDCLQKDVIEAMEYSLLAGGKRIRPTLTLEFCRVRRRRAGGYAVCLRCGNDPFLFPDS